jgi:hypothetical protein
VITGYARAVRAQVRVPWPEGAAPSAASELIVPATALKEPGCSPAATVQPPTSGPGATADETRPHHGTPRTTTTVTNALPASHPNALIPAW